MKPNETQTIMAYKELFDDAVAMTLIVFGWLSVLIAVYGAIVFPPPETATFRWSGISD